MDNPAAASDLLASILALSDFHPRLPAQRRLYEAAKEAIHKQQLTAGAKLPSSRDLAKNLAVARNTVIAAYEQLMAEGFVTGARGSGTYVAHLPQLGHGAASAPAVAQQVAPAVAPLSQRGARVGAAAAGPRFEIEPFAPGDADFSSFPIKLWQSLQNRVWREMHSELLDYSDNGGYLPLRQAITAYLRLSRSVKVNVEQVIITAGTQQSLNLCAHLLADVGETVWVEDPGYWAAQRVFQAADLAVHPVPIDKDGLAPRDSDLETRPRLMYVTPSHQYPTGAVMSLARRLQLLDIAARQQAWVLEDDYDSEFRYTGRPLASLQGLDNENRVVYIGTFSKVLYPGIKVGYMVLPPVLVEAFRSAQYDLHRPGQLMVQAALAEFISEGHFASHLRKIRQTYGARREALKRTLEKHLGSKTSITISSEESGLHLVVELPDHVDDVALSKLAAESGIRVNALSTYYLSPPVRRGLLVGYAYVTLEKISYYGKLLASIIESAER
ncbi:MocR-like pyridoxine biosynthesis transcription factor PdxR [Duganella flavida]|uniref:MocR-like pyridoxine biosynthesis transcription factor PdxR n=1 Tax=Duganella flavida TaxID=2692175 RepID=UPI001E41054D|nr:PLP-dependent aminotransferase family protein [Duganella flavida]